VPRVSVVVSHHDRRRCLRQALDSIAAQTWRDFEVVVVSDAGPEASRAVVDAFAAAHAGAFDVGFVRRERNGGVAATRNTGARAARGTLLAWLDDDDLWRPGHLGALVRAVDGGAEVAYGDAEVWRMEPPAGEAGAGAPGADEEGGLDPTAWRVAERRLLAVPFAADDLRRDDFIVPGGMLHSRALLEATGFFDETLFVSDDWDWLLRVLAARGPDAFARVPGVVVDVRIWQAAGGVTLNLSADAGSGRRAALGRIARRHGLAPLEPKTFWEVAGTYAAGARSTSPPSPS
jgi:glycosyltransferase involved in cell wall biosynthesis